VTLTTVVNCGFRGFVYLGLFLAPISRRGSRRRARPAPGRRRVGRRGRRARRRLFVRERALMFYLTNVLYDSVWSPHAT